MGDGRVFRCKSCGYEYEMWTGVGMAYPRTYKEAMEDAKEGRYGNELKTFIEEHPDCAIDITLAPYVCENCGQYSSAERMDAFVPKDGAANGEDNSQIWSTAFSGAGYNYVTPSEIIENYTLSLKHRHRCECCGGDLRELSEKEIKKGLACPRCHSLLVEEDMILWD